MDTKSPITVAVIGAGSAGVTAVKCALDEGLKPTCFEQDDQIGGLWRYTENVRENQGAAAYEGLSANDGKELMAYSDFPMPEKNATHMPWQEYLKYIIDYANHFGVTKHIRFNTTVVKVTPAADYSSTGRWEVHTKAKGSNEVNVQRFDKIMIAVGPFRAPRQPKIPGMENFKGEIMHAKDYRKQSVLKGKRVMVVGDGLYGAEITNFAGDLAEKTYFVVNSNGGVYLYPRLSQGGNFAFSMGVSRSMMLDMDWENMLRPAFENVAKQWVDGEKFGIRPKLPLLGGGRYGLASNIPDQLEAGRVIPKRGLKQLTETGAIFEDGSEIRDIDLVVLATGFDIDLSVIDLPAFKDLKRRQEMNAYLWEFPLCLSQDSLALVGCATLPNPFAYVAELHSRLAARVFSGKHRLPSREVREKWVKDKEQYFKEKTAGKFQMLPIRYSDEIAEELGVVPSFWRLFWRSPTMAHKVHNGPNLPLIYRLVGPGAKKSAWKEYDDWYRRGFAGGTPPSLPWGLHHYAAVTSVAVGVVAACVGVVLTKTDILKMS